MKTIKLAHILFSLTVIAALALAVVPTPVFSLSAGSAGLSSQPTLTATGGLVCHTVVIWHNGHRTVIRRCHRVSSTAS